MDGLSITTLDKSGMPTPPPRRNQAPGRLRRGARGAGKVAKGLGGAGVFAAMLTSAVESAKANRETRADREDNILERHIKEENLEYIKSQNAKVKMPLLSILGGKKLTGDKMADDAIRQDTTIKLGVAGAATVMVIGFITLAYCRPAWISGWFAKPKLLGDRDAAILAEAQAALAEIEGKEDKDSEDRDKMAILRAKIKSLKDRV